MSAALKQARVSRFPIRVYARGNKVGELNRVHAFNRGGHNVIAREHRLPLLLTTATTTYLFYSRCPPLASCRAINFLG